MISREALIRLALSVGAPVILVVYILVTSHSLAQASTRTIERLVIPAIMFAIALIGFSVRAGRLRARRARVPGAIAGDIRIDEYTFTQVAARATLVDQHAKAGVYTVVVDHDNLELWTSARMLTVPFSRIASIEAPSRAAKSLGPEIELTFVDGEELPVLLTLLGPLSGLFPPSRQRYRTALSLLTSQLVTVGG